MQKAAARSIVVQRRSLDRGWPGPLFLFATCALVSCSAASVAPPTEPAAALHSIALPAVTGYAEKPGRQPAEALVWLAGDELHAQSASAEVDSLLHAVCLTASTAQTPICWAMYEFADLDWSGQPWVLGVDTAGELPEYYWLGVADFAAQCWRWSQVRPAMDEHTLLISGVTQPARGDCAYVVIAVDAGQQLTLSNLSLVAGCALPASGFGCDLAGQALAYAGWQVAWGDLHAHSAFSGDAANEYNEGCTVEPAAACAYARDVAKLDFVAITDHAELSGVGNYTEEKWQAMLQQEQALTELYPSERSIVIFPGFEFTKPGSYYGYGFSGGHKTVVFRDFVFTPPRVYGYDALDTPYALWKWLDNTAASHNYMTIPHHLAKGGMHTDWTPYNVNAEVQPLVEIYSRHGSSESMFATDERVFNFVSSSTAGAATAAWLVDHNPGYKLGFIAATDGHEGEPGNVSETLDNQDLRIGYTTGGLAAVWVPAIARDEIWAGLRAKNCYATSGARIYLEFTAKLGEQQGPMGATLYHQQALTENVCAMVNLHMRVAGDAGRRICRILLYKDGVPYHDWQEAGWGSIVHLDYTDLLETDYAFYRIKVWQDKAANPLPENDACERAWSSPIWIEPSSL